MKFGYQVLVAFGLFLTILLGVGILGAVGVYLKIEQDALILGGGLLLTLMIFAGLCVIWYTR